MSQTIRWYVIGPEGGRWVILGWSKTAEAADARLTKQLYGITVHYLKRNADTQRWEWTHD